MDLCGEKKALVLEQLMQEVRNNGYALNTGFLSTLFLLPVLCDNGQTDAAYKVLGMRAFPAGCMG